MRMRIYASASGSGVASPVSADRSPRVVFLLGSGGVVKPLRPVAPPRPLKKRQNEILVRIALLTFLHERSSIENRCYLLHKYVRNSTSSRNSTDDVSFYIPPFFLPTLPYISTEVSDNLAFTFTEIRLKMCLSYCANQKSVNALI